MKPGKNHPWKKYRSAKPTILSKDELDFRQVKHEGVERERKLKKNHNYNGRTTP